MKAARADKENGVSKAHARLTILLDALKKQEFEERCAELGTTPSEVVRQLVAEFIRREDKAALLLPTPKSGKGGPRENGTD